MNFHCQNFYISHGIFVAIFLLVVKCFCVVIFLIAMKFPLLFFLIAMISMGMNGIKDKNLKKNVTN